MNLPCAHAGHPFAGITVSAFASPDVGGAISPLYRSLTLEVLNRA